MAMFNPNASMMDMVDLEASLQDPMMSAGLGNNPALSSYSDDIQMDLSQMPMTFDAMDATGASFLHDDTQLGELSEISTVHGQPSGAGAGPLPTGFGAPNIPGQGSTLTEFTKRRNWSQRVIEEIKDLLYILTPDGRILYSSPSTKPLTGYDPSELVSKLISDFLHIDDSTLFIREFNESIASGNPLRFYYRFRTAENKYMIFECHGHPHLTSDVSHLEVTGGPVNAAGFCRGFFMMARPYPSRNTELLDSFLEHKLENVRLQARIAVLQREEKEEAESQNRRYHKKAGGVGSGTASQSADMTSGSPSMASRMDPSDYSSMPPPAKPTISNIALTREALDEANAFARPDSITDKMARYEGSSHVDSIEMLTGLRYREGERSQGISTGGVSPNLIRGDAGIDIPADKADPRYGGNPYLDKKPKKVKSADEYVCTDCGTLDSPEWRKGPNGPKTLCNACGLRWAKKEKKRGGPGGNDGNSQTNGSMSGGGSGNNMMNMNPMSMLKQNGSVSSGNTL